MNAMPAVSEKDFQQSILDLAGVYGWLAFHDFDSRHSTPGFPDLVLVRPPELIVAELKTDTGRLGPAQQLWLGALGEVAQAVREFVELAFTLVPVTASRLDRPAIDIVVWRPADFDEIHARLRYRVATARRPA